MGPGEASLKPGFRRAGLKNMGKGNGLQRFHWRRASIHPRSPLGFVYTKSQLLGQKCVAKWARMGINLI